MTVENNKAYELLAEVICKYCTENKLTQKDIMSAITMVLDKFYNDATI